MRRKDRKIYFRYIEGSDVDVTLTVPQRIPAANWNSKKQEAVENKTASPWFSETQKADINEMLLTFKTQFLNEVSGAKRQHISITKKWVIEFRDNYFDTSRPKDSAKNKYLLLPFIESYIEKCSATNPTKDGYRTVLDRLKKYSDHKGTIYKVYEVDKDFGNDFIQWLKGMDYTPSTIKKTRESLLQFIGAASEDMRVAKDYKKFKYKIPKSNTITEVTLNAEEVKLVENYKTDDEFLERTRRLFLVGLRTGLRVVDLMRLNNPKTFYYDGDPLDKPRIENNTLIIAVVKTGVTCYIPLHPSIREIIKEVKHIPQPMFNKKIKVLAQEIGLTKKVFGSVFVKVGETVSRAGKKIPVMRKIKGLYPKYQLVKSHTMRRSYVTNRKAEKDTDQEIAAATGHGSTDQVINYDKTDLLKLANKKHQQWDQKI